MLVVGAISRSTRKTISCIASQLHGLQAARWEASAHYLISTGRNRRVRTVSLIEFFTLMLHLQYGRINEQKFFRE